MATKKFNPVTEVHQQAPNSPERQAEINERQAEIIQAARDKREAIDATQVNWRNKIAAAKDAVRDRSVEEVMSSEYKESDDSSRRNQIGAFETETHEEDFEEEIVTSVKEPTEEDYDVDGSQKITRTINGVKVTRTVDEWFAAAQKVEDADAYYQHAAQKLHEKKQYVPPVEDVKELAKKLQFGDEAEAEQAIQAVIQRSVEASNATRRQEDIQEAGKAVWLSFSREYDDVLKDPITNAAIVSREQQLIQEGRVFDADPVVNFDKRLRHVGEEIRNWKSNMADVSIKQEKREELINKKHQIRNLNTASTKAVSDGSEKPLSEREGRDQAVSSMFASRRKKSF